MESHLSAKTQISIQTRMRLASFANYQFSAMIIPCGPPNPLNAVFDGRLVLHTCPLTLNGPSIL